MSAAGYDILNHAFYSTQPGPCLCAMCLGDCRCGKPGIVPLKSRAKRGWTPYCEACAIQRAKRKHAHHSHSRS